MRILCTLLATITVLLAGCNTSTTPSSNAPKVAELINKAQSQAQSGDFKDAYATLKTAESLDKTNRSTLIRLVQMGHDLAIQSNAAQNDAKSAPLFLESATGERDPRKRDVQRRLRSFEKRQDRRSG